MYLQMALATVSYWSCRTFFRFPWQFPSTSLVYMHLLTTMLFAIISFVIKSAFSTTFLSPVATLILYQYVNLKKRSVFSGSIRPSPKDSLAHDTVVCTELLTLWCVQSS
jgi:hypothetical protein